MLMIFDSIHGLDLAKLQQVYADNSNDYFYEDTLDFLSEKKSVYAVWVDNGKYVSALRWQSFYAGFLIAGVETRPEERRKGYAQDLLHSVLEYFKSDGTRKVYSHIQKDNLISEKTHCNCGFEIVFDYAHLLDGSISRQYNTFLIKI